MFDELEKYKEQGSFFFRSEDRLSEVCNAPKDCSGLYLIYSLKQGKVELIYIGISGRRGSDNKIIHRKDGLRGRFLTGKQFGDRRSITWPVQMKIDGIEALHVHWFVTFGSCNSDFPRELEEKFLSKYATIYGAWPSWNKKG